jgi:serine protease Do
MSKKLLFTIGLIILVISTMGLLGCTTQPSVAQTPTTPAVSGLPATSPAQEMGTLTIPEVITKVKPSVVSINVEITAYDFFNRPVKEEGAGSGWIIDSDGYIVTNNHVVQDADNVTVTLDDGRIFQAESVKTDALTDLAVVKIDATGLPAVSVGDSSELQIGDSVIAIGNSLGQGISATAGIVSVTDVSLDTSSGQTLLGLIQTDAAINPGNSGGPLVNMEGEVIGINSLKVSQVGVEGMGYAISINEAAPVINALIEKGYIVRPWLGIGITTVNEFVASIYNLSVNNGVLVANVVQDSPADKAGLEQGDIITAIDDQDISDTGELTEVISSSEVGQTIKVTYWRGDKEQTVDVTLAESPPPQY